MWSYFLVVATILFGNEVLFSSTLKFDRQMNLNLCMKDKYVTANILKNSDDEVTCQCQATKSKVPTVKKDYTYTLGIGSHKLYTDGKPWNEARKICNEDGGYLAIINSREEENVLVTMLNNTRESIKDALNNEEAYLGVHDLYSEDDWVTVNGEPLRATGYTHWSRTYAGGQPDNYLGKQNCAALTYQGGMDDCTCEDKFAFFCELPLTCA